MKLLLKKYPPSDEELLNEKFLALNSDTSDLYGIIHSRYIRSPEGESQNFSRITVCVYFRSRPSLWQVSSRCIWILPARALWQVTRPSEWNERQAASKSCQSVLSQMWRALHPVEPNQTWRCVLREFSSAHFSEDVSYRNSTASLSILIRTTLIWV